VGFETLIRWQHPDHGLASPAVFLPLAEETGLIVQIDQWVLQETHQRVGIWQRNYPSFASMFVTVNLSEKHLDKSGLVEFLEQILAKEGVESHRLKIEFPESGIIENFEFVMGLFSKLKSMGIDVLIDDFEASYSSLTYLSKLPIYALKIENTLVSLMASQQEQQSLVHEIIRLSQRLGIKVIIKGIETREQLNQAKSMGFRYGQGRLISEPVQAEAVERLLAKGAGFSIKI
jgi:EAL domain-containing protein (putative c-di-GMP-specific phosphodiesterase class I)